MVIVGGYVLKYAHVVTQTSSESFPKASQWLSLRTLARDLPSFCLQQGHPSGVMSNPTASSSCGLSVAAPWSDKGCCHLVSVGGAGITDTVGGEAVDISSLPAVASCRVVAGIPKMAAIGMLPVRSCKGYISTPWASGGQAHRTAPQASRNAWWSHPSSAMASHSNSSVLSLWDFSKAQGWITWWASASLIMAAHWTSASLMASVAWASFWHMVILAFCASSLQWECMVALVMSSHSKAAFITPCSQTTYSVRLAGSALEGAWDWWVGEMLATSGLLGIVGRDIEWLTWTMLGMFLVWPHAGMPAKRWPSDHRWLSPSPSGWVDLLLWWRVEPLVPCCSGLPLSGADLGWVHLWWPHSRAVAPQSQTAELQGPHLAPQGKPPSCHIAVASAPAIGPGDHRHLY